MKHNTVLAVLATVIILAAMAGLYLKVEYSGWVLFWVGLYAIFGDAFDVEKEKKRGEDQDE